MGFIIGADHIRTWAVEVGAIHFRILVEDSFTCDTMPVDVLPGLCVDAAQLIWTNAHDRAVFRMPFCILPVQDAFYALIMHRKLGDC